MSREADPGYGPPPGNPYGPARAAGEVPFSELARMAGLEGGRELRGSLDATDENTRARARLVYRDLPLLTVQNTWTVEQCRGAMYSHLIGMFYVSGQLCDSMLGDDRISATLNSRASAWLGREVRFAPANDSAAAREVLDAWVAWWPRFSGDAAIRQTSDYGTMMGFGHDQLVWDTTQPGLDYAPTMHPWHPVFTYYDWSLRCFMAIGQDGTIPIVPGNGKWVEYAPFGSYRGWIRGAIRACVEPWLLRHFGFRDMARFGEVHGNPTRIGYVPMVGDPVERASFFDAIAKLGADTALMVPRGVDVNDGTGYDYKLVESSSGAWQVHPSQIDRCDQAIALALLTVSQTTEIGGGVYGPKVAQDVRFEGSQLDNQSWKRTLYNQVTRVFAYLNYGDANLAPWTWWDVKGAEEYANNARQFQAVSAGIETLNRGGVKFRNEEEVRAWVGPTFGLDHFPAFTLPKPVVVAASAGAPAGEQMKLELAPTDLAIVVKVNEARASAGLGPLTTDDGKPDPDGELTIAAYKAKNAETIAAAVEAESPDAAAASASGGPELEPEPEEDDEEDDAA